MGWVRGFPLFALAAAGCIDNPFFGLHGSGMETEPEATSSGEVVTGATGVVETSGSSSTGEAPTSEGSTSGGVMPCDLRCGDPLVCCGIGEACVLDACVPACDSGVRCGADLSLCCGEGEACVAGACTEPAGACIGGADCKPGHYCDPELHVCVPQAEPAECVLDQPVGFEVEETWANATDEVLGTPMVVDLTGDGVPEVVVNTARAQNDPSFNVGEVVCLDGATGAEVWRIVEDLPNMRFGAHGLATLGIGDVSGDGRPDVVYAGRPDGMARSAIHAVDGDGTLLWTGHSADPGAVRLQIQHGAPALVNLDGDAMAEVAFGAAVFDHDGRMVWNQGAAGGIIGSPNKIGLPNDRLYSGGLGTFAQLDGAGPPELITGREAWKIAWVQPPNVSLSLYWANKAGAGGDGWPAVADLDGNGTPEVVLIAWPELRIVDAVTGELWCGVDPTGVACQNNAGMRTQPAQFFADDAVNAKYLGGPATIADFDGDGRLEFALSVGTQFRVYDVARDGEEIVLAPGEAMPVPGAFYVRWAAPVQEGQSATSGASAFDFDDDGAAEVLFQDECHARVYDGATGAELLEIMNSSATVHEYPVVADVDADGRTDLLVVANLSDEGPGLGCMMNDPADYTLRKGVYAYHAVDGRWAATRRVWTQHTHHVTDADDAGNVPMQESPHWIDEGTNRFRAAHHAEIFKNAPDLTVSLAVEMTMCVETLVLQATVSNVGASSVPPGVTVTFVEGADDQGVVLGSGETSKALGPGGFEVVALGIPAPGEPRAYRAIVDRDQAIAECREDNNGDGVGEAACSF